jgi:hypothetical protein
MAGMAQRMFPPAAAVPVFVLVWAIGCGGSGGESIQSFAPDYAQAYCHRIYECCVDDDRPTGALGPDEATCATAMTGSLRENISLLLAHNEIKFNGEAAARCLAQLRTGSCPEIFEVAFASLRVCADAFTGTRQLGEPCDADFSCASGDCESQRCVVRPCSDPNHCSANEYCIPSTEACVLRGVTGAACTDDGACTDGLICLKGTCTERRQDGEACMYPGECSGTCKRAPAASMGVCRPGLCQGR